MNEDSAKFYSACDQSFATALDGHTDTYEEDDDTFICLPFADNEHKMGDNLENNNTSDVTKKTVQGALHRMIMDEGEEPAAVERVRIELNSLKHCLGKSDLDGAKDAHLAIARVYKDAAASTCADGYADDDIDDSFARSLLLLSHMHIYRASALDNMSNNAKKSELSNNFLKSEPSSDSINDAQNGGCNTSESATFRQDEETEKAFLSCQVDGFKETPEGNDHHESRNSSFLRNVIRGALDKSASSENEMSNSVFLQSRQVVDSSLNVSSIDKPINTFPSRQTQKKREDNITSPNPVDDVLIMERELRNLNMGLSVCDDMNFATASNDESITTHPSEFSSNTKQKSTSPSINASEAVIPTKTNLESSWWGGRSTTSLGLSIATMSSSLIPLRSKAKNSSHVSNNQQSNVSGAPNPDTKQMLNLLESIRTLSEENTALLKRIDDADAAREEAERVKAKMIKFKSDYGKRFSTLKAALDKFRAEYPSPSTSSGNTSTKGTSEKLENPVSSSEYLKEKVRSESERARQREKLIRKMDTELRRLKDEGKKKDAVLKKYENFYKEVKARANAKRVSEKQRNRASSSH